MASALTGQDRPRATPTAAIPGRSVFVLAIEVTCVTPPARTRREAHLERRIDSLQAPKNAIILRPAEPIANQLEKLGRDGALGGTVVGITGETHVLARR